MTLCAERPADKAGGGGEEERRRRRRRRRIGFN